MKIGILREILMDLAVAFSLLTRLPLPAVPNAAFDKSARAVWCYPLVGLALALPAATVFWLGSLAGLPPGLGAGFVLAVLAAQTGAMHEDGLGDCSDGFWGGHDRARRLEIMKDSQIGTYGTLALVLVTGMRWSCYAALLPAGLSAVFIAAALSRAVMPMVMHSLPHARSNGLSHGVGRPRRGPVLVGLGFAAIVALLLSGPVAVAAVIAALFAAAGVAWVAQRKIGGQTGDVLGATQQVAEFAALCAMLVVLT